VRMQKSLSSLVAVAPLSSRRVVAEEKHARSRDAYKDEWHDERNAPGLRRRQALIQPERVVDDRHKEVSDAASRIACRESQHNILDITIARGLASKSVLLFLPLRSQYGV
jgi:hypothetical protein